MIRSRDFTVSKYLDICRAALDSGYTPITVKDYFTFETLPERFVIMRHDVDDAPDIPYTLDFARKEADLGISSTYYFRVFDGVFDVEAVKEVADLGHEIGYHYDTLSNKSGGDVKAAIKLFESELEMLREVCDVQTISQHGGPLRSDLKTSSAGDIFRIVKSLFFDKQTFTSFKNKTLWDEFDFKDFGVIGDALLSVDFSDVAYFSDTGRSWSDSTRLNDFLEAGEPLIQLHGSDELIRFIRNRKSDRILILTHPPNWREGLPDWLNWLLLQKIRNTGKRLLKIYWKLSR